MPNTNSRHRSNEGNARKKIQPVQSTLRRSLKKQMALTRLVKIYLLFSNQIQNKNMTSTIRHAFPTCPLQNFWPEINDLHFS